MKQTVEVHKPIVDSKVFIKASSRIVPIHLPFKTACQLTLKQKISCIPIARFSLMFKGKFLEPGVPLEDYGIQDGSIIEVVMKGIGGNGTDQHKSVNYHFCLTSTLYLILCAE